MQEKCLFEMLNDDELLNIDAGGWLLSAVCATLTVIAVVAVVYCAPPGTKYKAAEAIAVGGFFLACAAYTL
ncbi:MAG: hypothetical protein ACYDEX_06860 [Mobilitalea sp.]